MTVLLTGALLLLTAIALIPAALISVQIGATFLRQRKPRVGDVAPEVAVVVPAHNESGAIRATIESIRGHLPPGARLLVVADNCTDSTAQVAAAAGAEVSERRDTTRLGKGYALDHGIRVLQAAPPQVVVFVDADCQVGTDTIATIAKLCFSTGQPVQAHDVMQSPSSARLLDRLSQFAWTVKTFVRPQGAANLGWPCQLMGTGMALPWDVFGLVDLGTGHLAEDQKLGADLALAGKVPLFCPQARVTSFFPAGTEAKRTQRTRWEHGHLAIIGDYFPRLLMAAMSRRSLSLLAFALDLCIPPLSLLALSLVSIELICLLWLVATGSVAPFAVSSISMFLFATAIAFAWWRFGRDTLSLRDLFAAPAYCLARIPSFLRFFVSRRIEWIRTDRL